MSRPTSPSVTAALADIQSGMTWRDAAAKHQVAMSSIKRALDRIASQCPCCGRPIKNSAKGTANV